MAEQRVTVETAFFRPDRVTAYQWFEGAADIPRNRYPGSGMAEVYLRNSSSQPMRVARLRVNGRDITQLGKGEDIVWWRLRPNPLPANAFGELVIRFRSVPVQPVRIEVQLQDGEGITVRVPVTPPVVRLESFSVGEDGRQLFVYLEYTGGGDPPTRVRKVYLDGSDITRRARVLSRNPWQGLCPIVLDLPQPLSTGSFHYLLIETTAGAIGLVFRARDGFFPLGSYGYVTPEEYATNDVNLYVSFSGLDKQQLDNLWNHHVKAISMVAGDGKPRADNIGHPALWAYYLADEPDVQDYYEQGLPADLRVGTKAMEMVRRDEACYRADAHALTFLTVDLTYKPANWYIYGRIADVHNTDPYALLVGWNLRQVYEVAETARLASAPTPTVITYQAMWIEPIGNPSDAKYPRMPTPEEVRIMMHYALAAGAKGLISYIHCTERVGEQMFWGAKDYPEVWAVIGKTYREVKTIAPILAHAHPAEMVTSQADGLFVKALVAPEAVVLVCVNERGKSLPHRYVSQSLPAVTVQVLTPPWLPLKRAFLVGEGTFISLPCRPKKERTHLQLPEIETACMVLLTRDDSLTNRLAAAYRATPARTR